MGLWSIMKIDLLFAMRIHISEGEKTVAKSRLARSMETLVYLTLVLILFKNIMLLQYSKR
jgi:hypothetical protein